MGKTSLVKCFVNNRFDDACLSSIGVKISRKSVDLGGNTLSHMPHHETLRKADDYCEQFLTIHPQAQIIIVASKCDLTEEHEINSIHLQNLFAKMKTSLFITGAEMGEHVEDAFYEKQVK